MSMPEERALAEIVTRLAGISGVTGSVEIEPDDENPDLLSPNFKRLAVLPGEAQPAVDQKRQQLVVVVPVMVRGLTNVEPSEGNDGLPLSARTAGYALLSEMLAALFPEQTSVAYIDRLGGAAISFTYQAHAIYPRDDGGKTVGVYIDTEVQYVLHLNDPDK